MNIFFLVSPINCKILHSFFFNILHPLMLNFELQLTLYHTFKLMFPWKPWGKKLSSAYLGQRDHVECNLWLHRFQPLTTSCPCHKRHVEKQSRDSQIPNGNYHLQLGVSKQLLWSQKMRFSPQSFASVIFQRRPQWGKINSLELWCPPSFYKLYRKLCQIFNKIRLYLFISYAML